jgi:hypothetical protein
MEARDRIGADLARGGTTTLAASFNLNEDARGDVA